MNSGNSILPVIDFKIPDFQIEYNFNRLSWNEILNYSFSKELSFALTSHIPEDPRSEFSFIAINPILKFTVYSKKISYQFDGKNPVEFQTDNPFDFIENIFIKKNGVSNSSLDSGGIFLSIGYEFAKFIETEKTVIKSISENQPLLIGMVPQHIFRRNENNGSVDLIYCNEFSYLPLETRIEHNKPQLTQFEIETDFHTYKMKIDKLKKYISNGDTYEVNFSHQVNGEFNSSNNYDIWKSLVSSSPSSFFSNMNSGDFSLISSSPERFLKIQKNKLVVQPMKGTRKSTGNKEADQIQFSDLSNNEKDRAENVMIVDLMRNDIGKISKTGSVKVTELFKIEKYKTVFQMISTIESELKENITFSDILKATFPPGSMTGAPKIRTMEIIAELEDQPREFYSGIIGYYGFDGNAEFSVLIRCLEKTGTKFKAKFGGAVVADSEAENEFEETKIKMSGILNAFGRL